MSKYEAFTGLPVEQDEDRTRRWSKLLVRVGLAVFVLSVLLAAIFWGMNADVGALMVSIGFAVLVALMVLRQALLAERR